MTREEFEAWVLDEYAAIVENAGKGGIKVGDAVDELADVIQAAVDEGSAVIPTDVRALIASVVDTADEKSRRAQVTQMKIFKDCVNDATILGRDDPIMQQVARCGSGVRKAWGNCGIEDIQTMTGVKTQHAADAAIAANEWQHDSQPVLRALLRAGHNSIIRDLFS